jgi:hypothetical protein
MGKNDLLTKVLPTILFSFVGLLSITKLIEGDHQSRNLSRSTVTEREDRVERERQSLSRRVEGITNEREAEEARLLAKGRKEYEFGKRIPR